MQGRDNGEDSIIRSYIGIKSQHNVKLVTVKTSALGRQSHVYPLYISVFNFWLNNLGYLELVGLHLCVVFVFLNVGKSSANPPRSHW